MLSTPQARTGFRRLSTPLAMTLCAAAAILAAASRAAGKPLPARLGAALECMLQIFQD